MKFTSFNFKLYINELAMLLMVFLSTVIVMCSSPDLPNERTSREPPHISNVKAFDSLLHTDQVDSKRTVEDAQAVREPRPTSDDKEEQTKERNEQQSVLESQPTEDLATGVYRGEPEMLEEEDVFPPAIVDSDYVDQGEEVLDQQPPDHQTFGNFLEKNVTSSGIVDYVAIKADVEVLDAYLQSLKEHPVVEDWSKNAKLSYWINAYNAFTIKLIVDHYPVKSIMDIENGKPWDKKWIELGDQTYSLNQIEHEIIRPQFGDPRIHFAVNCAARSCPPLANEAFTEANVNQLLTDRTRLFINNDKYNTLTKTAIKISKIFDWYREDFGDVISYLNKYANTEIDDDASIDFLEYDWKLNGK